MALPIDPSDGELMAQLAGHIHAWLIEHIDDEHSKPYLITKIYEDEHGQMAIQGWVSFGSGPPRIGGKAKSKES